MSPTGIWSSKAWWSASPMPTISRAGSMTRIPGATTSTFSRPMSSSARARRPMSAASRRRTNGTNGSRPKASGSGPTIIPTFWARCTAGCASASRSVLTATVDRDEYAPKRSGTMQKLRICMALAAAMMSAQSAAAEDFLNGARLYADVTRYASFGTHRFGTTGDRATADWIAGELKAAGFRIEFQPVVLGRQYVVERATAEAGGATVEATPFWWPPEDKSSFRLAAPLVRDGDAAGRILWVELPYDRGAYLGAAHRAAIAQAASKGPAAILLT